MHIPTFDLADGTAVPHIGFGTYKLTGNDGLTAIKNAYEAGYRWFDTAVKYNNEELFGQLFAETSINPTDITVVSKLPGTHHERDAVKVCLRESLKRLGLIQVDYYLIHWPNPARGEVYREAWRGLLDCRDAGLARQVAVANFTPKTLDAIYTDTHELPLFNQVECHPAFAQEELLKHHQDLGIMIQSWSPLGKNQALYDHPMIQELSQRHGKTPAQVILRWHIERGCMPIPKAASPNHQQENINIFDFSLEREEVEAISALSHPDGRLFDADPDRYIEV